MTPTLEEAQHESALLRLRVEDLEREQARLLRIERIAGRWLNNIALMSQDRASAEIARKAFVLCWGSEPSGRGVILEPMDSEALRAREGR